MSTSIRSFKQSDLILSVSKFYDTNKLDLSAWELYLNRLCGDREYQKEAITTAIIFLASKRYKTTIDLVNENFDRNTEIKAKFGTKENYINQLQLKDKLFANIDLATGTGKSYVIYGIAQIMLSLGLVDKILVLCPSTTIESGLFEKFVQLSGDNSLTNTIPPNSKYTNPRIISANETIKHGDICVENIHAVYSNTGSSIDDSLKNKNENILVLNDESHHIFNKNTGSNIEEKDFKKWKEFLLSPDYKFDYILGFTGTAYVNDNYFNDVIYRFSLRDAIEQKYVKNIDYVKEDDSTSDNEKFQKIYQNHNYNTSKYPLIKPLTILITKDVSNAKKLASDLKTFIIEVKGISEESADKEILIVTSHNDHKSNVKELKYVDSIDSKVNWIVSVSMLNEGWDVKNVFQIVPWEDRAFNSKLLVSQVLGRGLRIPEQYLTPQPKVIVFNHKSFSYKIKRLVDEVLEIESRINSEPIKKGERYKYHFDIYNLNYSKVSSEVVLEKQNKSFDYTRLLNEGIELESQTLEEEKETIFTSILGNNERSQKFIIENITYSIDDVLDQLFDAFDNMEWEGVTLQLGANQYTQNKLPQRNEIRNIIEKSMKKRGNVGERIIEKNKNRILNTFNTLLRKSNKSIVYNSTPNELICKSTKDINVQHVSISNFRSTESTLFHSSNWNNEIEDNIQLELIQEMIDDESLPKSSSKIINEFLFKTPLTTVISSSEPEYKFVQNLFKPEIVKVINSWVKSRDKGFYEIEYSIRLGSGDSKTRKYIQRIFNPDFIILIKKEDYDYLIVIEVKQDGDISEENYAKYKAAKDHFYNLNEILESKKIKQKYIFHFLSPNSYSSFFSHMTNGTLFESQESFQSDLETKFKEEY